MRCISSCSPYKTNIVYLFIIEPILNYTYVAKVDLIKVISKIERRNNDEMAIL